MSGTELLRRPPYPEPPETHPFLPDGSPNPAWPPSYRDISASAAWLAYRARQRGVYADYFDDAIAPVPEYRLREYVG